MVVGGDARLSQPITIIPGGSGLNTSTHLRSLINHFGIDDTGFEVHFQTVINENDQYGTLLASHAKKIGINLLNRRVSHFPSCFLGTEESLIQNDGIKSTGHCAVIVSKGERSFMTYLGCLEDFRGSHIIDESVNHSYDLQHVHVSGVGVYLNFSPSIALLSNINLVNVFAKRYTVLQYTRLLEWRAEKQVS